MCDHTQNETSPEPETRPAPARRRGATYLRLAIAVALLLLVLRLIDVRLVVRTVVGANLGYVVIVLVGFLADRFLMAYKWNLLLRSKGIAFSNMEAFRVYLASGFVGTFLPTGVGADVYRAVRTTVGRGNAGGVTASIVVERVIGFVAVTLMALLGLAILMAFGETQFKGLFLFTAVVLLLIVIAFAVSIQSRTFTLMKRLLSRFEEYKIVRLYLDSHQAYLDLSRDRSTAWIFFVLTFLEQGLLAVLNYWGARAIGIDVEFIYFLAVIPLSTLAVRLPISIGAIGVLEGTYVLLFARAGLSATESVSLSLIMRVIGWLVLIPAGLIFLTDLWKSRRARDPA